MGERVSRVGQVFLTNAAGFIFKSHLIFFQHSNKTEITKSVTAKEIRLKEIQQVIDTHDFCNLHLSLYRWFI